MRIVTIKGGVGNQLFQYLFYLYLKKTLGYYNVVAYLDTKYLQGHNGWELDKWFNISLDRQDIWLRFVVYLYKLLSKLKLYPKITQDNFSFSNGLYDDYWQDKRFFGDNVGSLEFSHFEVGSKNMDIINKINIENSVSIHIRRGDYLSPKYYPVYGNVCTANYYRHALDIIQEKVDNPSYFVFSNDIEWVKQNLEIRDAYYIDWNHGDASFLDMYLMTFCKHHIIANSSFSFWGAMLAKQIDSINIYPEKWFNSKYKAPDMFPESWIGLPS